MLGVGQAIIENGSHAGGSYYFSEELLVKLRSLAKIGDKAAITTDIVGAEVLGGALDIFNALQFVGGKGLKEYLEYETALRKYEKHRSITNCHAVCEAALRWTWSSPLGDFGALVAWYKNGKCWESC